MSVCSVGMTGLVLLLSLCVSTAQGMRSDQIRHLR
jgi:hypothetical protein